MVSRRDMLLALAATGASAWRRRLAALPSTCALLMSGRAYVKVSAAYRISTRSPDYSDVAPLARALIAANPERVLWGSDWPHPDAARRPGRSPTELRPPLPVDDGRVLNQLAVWAPDPAIRHPILVENPARLYGF
jgi:predicted TIM-barrel fold metal-dependent hydrolase